MCVSSRPHPTQNGAAPNTGSKRQTDVSLHITYYYGGRGGKKEQLKKHFLDPQTNVREFKEIKVPPPARASSIQVATIIIAN